MLEYCITAGEGTLIDYGVCEEIYADWRASHFNVRNPDDCRNFHTEACNYTLFSAASPDCQTGQ